jgi:tetratricopeptide (TPR) repeat protein
MSDDTGVLWLTIDLDPGTADFFGLPSRLVVPEDRDAPVLGDDDREADLAALVDALGKGAGRRPDDPQRLSVLRFVRRWPRYADLDRYLGMGNATFAAAVAGNLLADDPGDPPALAARGLLAAREGKWERALDCFARVRERAPTHALTRLHTALCLVGAGRKDEGRTVLDDLARHPRLQSLARFWRYELDSGRSVEDGVRRAMDSAGGIRDAATSWERLEAEVPDNPEVLYARALRLPGSEHGEERESCLRRALERDPAHVPAAALLAALLRSGGRPGEALEILDAGLRGDPDHPLLLTGRGQVLEQEGRSGEALDTYRAALSGPLAAIPGASLLLAGQGLIRLGAGDEARSILLDAVEARPGDPFPHQLLARLDEFSAGGKETAERRLRGAVRACGPLPLLQYALGDLLRRSGRTVEAEGVFKILVHRHPRSPWGYRGLGDLLVAEKPVEALRRYAEAVERAPELPIPGYDYLRGVAALRAADPDTARLRLQRAAAAEPDNARYWCDLGAALFLSGDLESALAATERALGLEPGHPGFLHNLAAYHRARFRRNPLLRWRSGWTAWRLRRRAGRR